MFVAFITFTAPPAAVEALMGDHLAWLEAQHGAGTFLVSGPSGAEGGVIVMRGDDRAAAEALAASDPLARGGVADYELVQFRASQTATGVDA